MSHKENGAMGRFRVGLDLANNEDLILHRAGVIPADQVRRARIKGVVDSGAVRLVLPASVVKELGVPILGTVGVRYADRRRSRRKKVGNVWLELIGRDGVFSAIVEPKRDDALIGAIVLEELDLLVDCVAQRIYPRDPAEIISEAE